MLGRWRGKVSTFPSVSAIWEIVWADFEAWTVLLGFWRAGMVFEGSFGSHGGIGIGNNGSSKSLQAKYKMFARAVKRH